MNFSNLFFSNIFVVVYMSATLICVADLISVLYYSFILYDSVPLRQDVQIISLSIVFTKQILWLQSSNRMLNEFLKI